ncbi:MAG: hypothetical protein WD690_17135 [Vicinamibacterales bacterium]
MPRPSIFGHIADAASLVLVVLALPLGILIIGAPIAFLIKLAIDLAGGMFR